MTCARDAHSRVSTMGHGHASLRRWEFCQVKPGRFSNGGLDVEPAREGAGSLERGYEAAAGSLPAVQPPPPSPFSEAPAWEDLPDAEVQLRGYLDRAKEPKQKGFPPFETLSARIGEFSEPPYRTQSPRQTAGELAPRPSHPLQERRRASDLEWFEERFQELKTMVSRRESGSSEIVGINIKLAEIIDRVDRLSAVLPGEKTMAAVETQLAELSRSFDAARAQSSSDANRIARAAQEILAATEKAQEARAGFEEAARHTVKELGQAVTVSASRSASVTAGEIAAMLQERHDGSRLERMESELRALNTASRETCERTTAALERVHETLRVFLDKSNADPAQAPRRRAGIHNPISSGTHPYAIGEDFGSEPERKPRLDTITLRKPPAPDPNLADVFIKASEKLIVSQASGFAKPQETAPAPSPKTAPSPAIRDEEKSLPLFGLGIVAVMLLIASAALCYLHSTSEIPPFHLSVLPDVEPARLAPGIAAQGGQALESALNKAAGGRAKSAPSLFTASSQNHAPSPSQPEQREDLQALTNAASRGDREAQFRIAARFLSDGSLQNDASTAARWLARAADQGHTESQFVLASLYERGIGVAKDEAMARELYRKAANAGHTRAMHNLGVLLCAQDTPRDYQEAASWFARAAMAGVTDSQFNLAVLHERGLGLPRNIQKAYFWYEVASLAGDKEASRHADRLKRQLTETEMQLVTEQAGSWRPSVEQPTPPASNSASRS